VILRELGDGFGMGTTLFCYPFGLAVFDPLAAIRIGAAATAVGRAGGFALPLRSVVMFDDLMAKLKAAVGSDVYSEQWEQGSRLSMEQAVAEALALGQSVSSR
jgi:hypothetical protein